MFNLTLTLRLQGKFLSFMGAKDWLVEKAAVVMINQAVLKPYGTLTALKLDTTARTITAELQLNGETEPVRIEIHEYELIEEEGAAFLVIKSLSTSRSWLTRLASDFGVGRKFKLPDSVRKFIPMIR
jgi:hypothetical protein